MKPCTNLTIEGVDIIDASNGTVVNQYLCDEVVDPIGWNCTGAACVGGTASGEC